MTTSFHTCTTRLALCTKEKIIGTILKRVQYLRNAILGRCTDIGPVFSIGEEEEAKRSWGEERRRNGIRRWEDEERDRAKKRGLRSVCIGGKGERPSMWRTCAAGCCSYRLLPSRPKSAWGADHNHVDRRDSRHAKSPMTCRCGGMRNEDFARSGRVWRREKCSPRIFLGFALARETGRSFQKLATWRRERETCFSKL